MGTRGIASRGICVAGASAGSDALSPPWDRAVGAHGSCWADLHRPPRGLGAAGMGAVPWDPSLRRSPPPCSEACMIAKSLEGEAGELGAF